MTAPPGWCSPISGVSAALPAYERTTVRLDPGEAGEFGFACGMNMIHGTLIVEPAADGRPAVDAAGAPAAPPPGTAADAGAGSAGSRRRRPRRADAEAARRPSGGRRSADLARRVIAGAVLTLPVLFAVMAHELFKALGAGRAAEPLGAAGADHPGDVLHRVADPPHRLAGAGAPVART